MTNQEYKILRDIKFHVEKLISFEELQKAYDSMSEEDKDLSFLDYLKYTEESLGVLDEVVVENK